MHIINSKEKFMCMVLAIGVISFVSGGYIMIKAEVGQYLLTLAWQQQLLAHQEKKATLQTNITVNKEVTKPWPWADFYPVANLYFDRFEESHIVLNNDSGQALAFGPGFNTSTLPEQNISNVFIISGHNDTHFSVLEKLTLNDKVILTFDSGVSKIFSVNNIEIINLETEQIVLSKTEYSIESEKGNNELLLVTCYPFGAVNNSTKLRYIVYLS